MTHRDRAAERTAEYVRRAVQWSTAINVRSENTRRQRSTLRPYSEAVPTALHLSLSFGYRRYSHCSETRLAERACYTVGSRKRAAREAWLDWSHTAHLYRAAEQRFGWAAQDRPGLDLFSSPGWLCADVNGTQPIKLQVSITLSRAMAYEMRFVPGDYEPSEFINVMEWSFDRYTAEVSDDRCTVWFHCDDPEDAGNIAYLRGGEYHPEEIGWWTAQVLRARHVGLDVFRPELRADRLAHLRREPPCPFKAKVRQQRLGGDDLALVQALR